MSDAHKLFLQENENIKISKKTFENGQPKNIKLKRDVCRLI